MKKVLKWGSIAVVLLVVVGIAVAYFRLGSIVEYAVESQGSQQMNLVTELDGASVWQRLRHVTLPQMRFIMLVLLLLQIIATMQVFIEPFLLTGTSSPDTVTVMVLIYRYAFTVNNDFGLAAAMSVLLFVVLGAFSALYLRLTRTAD